MIRNFYCQMLNFVLEEEVVLIVVFVHSKNIWLINRVWLILISIVV